MDNKRLILLLVLLIVVFLSIILLSKTSKIKPSTIKKLKVTASFYPLAFLAERIGGQNVIVTNLTPAGAEPHDFEPSTRDIAELQNQDIILLNGGGFEGYASKINENIDIRKTRVVIVGQSLMSIPQDPHVWLDPVLYKKEAEVIAAAFVQKDPLNARLYTTNMQYLSHELDELDTEFRQGLYGCTQKNIITSHNAFGYLAKRYGLHQVALTGLSPDQEPSSRTLADVAAFAKENKISYIFFEDLVSPAITNTLAREINAQTLVFNPLEGLTKESRATGKTYITIQKENLTNLEIALNCKKI